MSIERQSRVSPGEVNQTPGDESEPPAVPETKAIGKHPCPECGGNLEWSAAKQALVCPYCGTVAAWKPSANADVNDAGNQVIEHDLDVIRSADYLIDMGPEGGEEGGRIVACGSQEDIRNCKESITGKFINAQTRYHE